MQSIGAATFGLTGEAQIGFASFDAGVGGVSPIALATLARVTSSLTTTQQPR